MKLLIKNLGPIKNNTQKIEINTNLVSSLLEKFSHFIEREIIDIYNIPKNSSLSQNISISFDFDIDF